MGSIGLYTYVDLFSSVRVRILSSLLQGPPFPTPMEYAPGNPPPYPSMEPFRALALPEGKDMKKPPTEDVKALTAEDLKPSPDGSLELIDRSIKEMQDCKDVFEGLFKGIEK